MADMALNEIWQLRVGFYTPTQAAVNVINFKVVHKLGVISSDAFVTSIDTTIAPLAKAVLSNDARYRGVSLQRAWPLPRTRASLAIGSDGPGTVVGEILPGQVAGIVSARTEFAGRKHRARIYLPFPGEGDNEDPGQPTTVYVTAAQAYGDAVYVNQTFFPAAGVNEVTLAPVVFHRADQTSDRIVDRTAKRMWATQRRRGSFGPRNPAPF